jgi:uncharacterized protein
MRMNVPRLPETRIPTVLLGLVLWSRRDQPCLDYCCVDELPSFHAIRGCVVTAIDGSPTIINYLVQCGTDWSTRAVHVQVTQGVLSRRLNLERDDSGSWSRDGETLSQFQGFADVDLGVTPATNTLPIRRLALEVDSAASIDAVWVRFPELSLERMAQRYTRLDEFRYRYETVGASFTAELEVDDQGIVVRDGDLWERVAP